ncbi:MAG: hypothetical protein KAQ74_03010, partial [Dehalococcoidia bacterium]|nr:hypothetical protein [Dehalococcoidia bacterium]
LFDARNFDDINAYLCHANQTPVNLHERFEMVAAKRTSHNRRDGPPSIEAYIGANHMPDLHFYRRDVLLSGSDPRRRR